MTVASEKLCTRSANVAAMAVSAAVAATRSSVRFSRSFLLPLPVVIDSVQYPGVDAGRPLTIVEQVDLYSSVLSVGDKG